MTPEPRSLLRGRLEGLWRFLWRRQTHVQNHLLARISVQRLCDERPELREFPLTPLSELVGTVTLICETYSAAPIKVALLRPVSVEDADRLSRSLDDRR